MKLVVAVLIGIAILCACSVIIAVLNVPTGRRVTLPTPVVPTPEEWRKRDFDDHLDGAIDEAMAFRDRPEDTGSQAYKDWESRIREQIVARTRENKTLGRDNTELREQHAILVAQANRARDDQVAYAMWMIVGLLLGLAGSSLGIIVIVRRSIRFRIEDLNSIPFPIPSRLAVSAFMIVAGASAMMYSRSAGSHERFGWDSAHICIFWVGAGVCAVGAGLIAPAIASRLGVRTGAQRNS